MPCGKGSTYCRNRRLRNKITYVDIDYIKTANKGKSPRKLFRAIGDPFWDSYTERSGTPPELESIRSKFRTRDISSSSEIENDPVADYAGTTLELAFSPQSRKVSAYDSAYDLENPYMVDRNDSATLQESEAKLNVRLRAGSRKTLQSLRQFCSTKRLRTTVRRTSADIPACHEIRRLSEGTHAKRAWHDGADDHEPRKTTPRTLPRLNSPAIKYRRRSSLNYFQPSSGTGSRTPDRFLPKRPSFISATESFRSNKDPRTLNTEERLARNKDASPDAFNPRRIVPSTMLQPNRSVPRRNISGNRSGSGGGSVLVFRRDPASPNGERQVSVGSVWRVGGLAPVSGVSNGRGGLIGSGTNAPLYTTSFSAKPKAQEDFENHENRLAEALELDRTARVLEFRDPLFHANGLTQPNNQQSPKMEDRTRWEGTEWILGGPNLKVPISQEVRTLPIAPFKVLDAPNLRDDFYCSVLAYCRTRHTLAVGLGSLLYAWSESQGVHLLNNGPVPPDGSWLTSLAFSSTAGGKSILAFGRSNCTLNLMSLFDSMLPRFEVKQPHPIASVVWKPTTSLRPSRCPTTPSMMIKAEDLLVGDEMGNVYYYSVEWPESWEVTRNNWSGSMTLLTRITVHSQQICGLSFSCDGSMFATGGNDNLCCLFRTNDVLQNTQEHARGIEEVSVAADGTRRVLTITGHGGVKQIKAGAEKYRWVHGAAVKAIAFCPWRDGLVATGGGSNDKCIHFFHTTSGTCLATISVSSQVTSLIWSTTRREIAATFGFAQPEHPYRIAVFSWPDCRQVAAIPWEGEHRALYAIPYRGGPNESQTSREGGCGMSRTAQEGCIVVASSDESVKFHEVWTSSRKATAGGGEGLLGGSDILEALEGIEKEGEVIR